MVESNDILASGDMTRIAKLPEAIRGDPIPREAAKANMSFLRTQVESWLAVLFNVFSSVGRDSQGMVGDVISAWASIADEQVYLLFSAHREIALTRNTGNCKSLSETHCASPPTHRKVSSCPGSWLKRCGKHYRHDP